MFFHKLRRSIWCTSPCLNKIIPIEEFMELTNKITLIYDSTEVTNENCA